MICHLINYQYFVTIACFVVLAMGLWFTNTHSDDRSMVGAIALCIIPVVNTLFLLWMLSHVVANVCSGVRNAYRERTRRN